MNNKIFDYFEKYGDTYVIDEFINRKSDRQSWGVLINPNQYQQALAEFTKYGRIERFPVKYIYQWMGIIMKNTVILDSNTNLAGHSTTYPSDEAVEMLLTYMSSINNKEYDLNRNHQIEYQVSFDEIYNEIKDISRYNNELSNNDWAILNQLLDTVNEDIGVHNYGSLKGQKNMFYDQDEVDQYDKDLQKKDNEKSSLIFLEVCKIYNNINNNEKIRYENNNFIKSVFIFDFLDDCGLYDWMKMPDGTDAWSDFGLKPIFALIEKYDSDDSPEKILVLINKILDIYHQRGDLSSIFVNGGAKALSIVSYGTNESKRKKNIIIKEKQILPLIKNITEEIIK